MPDTLYKRLGGYDAIAAVCDDLLPRLIGDAQLARFWQNRAEDSLRREKQLLVNFLCACSGGPLLLRRPRHEDLASRDGHQRERLAALYWPSRNKAAGNLANVG
jgi:truncated hemoglobin YjbI